MTDAQAAALVVVLVASVYVAVGLRHQHARARHRGRPARARHRGPACRQGLKWRSGLATLCGSLAMLMFASPSVTPLHEAASKGHTETVLALLEAGADPNAPITLGLGLIGSQTPLDAAADGGHTETVAALLKAGADPNAPGFTLGPGLLGASRTPLDAAAKGGHTKMVSALLKAGANPHARQHVAFGIKLLTPLDVARINGHTEMVPALLTAEAHTHRPIMSSETEVTGSTALVLLVATLYSLYRWPYLRSVCSASVQAVPRHAVPRHLCHTARCRALCRVCVCALRRVNNIPTTRTI